MDLSKYKSWAELTSQFNSQNAKYGSVGGEPSWSISGVGDFSPYYAAKNRDASPWDLGEAPQGYLMGGQGQNGTGDYQYLTAGANGGIDSRGYHHDHTSWQNDVGTLAATIAAPFAMAAAAGAVGGGAAAGAAGAGEAGAAGGGVGLTGGGVGSLASQGLAGGGMSAAGGAGAAGGEAFGAGGMGLTGNGGATSLAGQGIAGWGSGSAGAAADAGIAGGAGAASSGGQGATSTGQSSGAMGDKAMDWGKNQLINKAIGGVIGGIAGKAGGGMSGNGGNGYVPYNQQGLDQSFNGNFNAYHNQVNSSFAQMQPNMQQNFQNQYNNPNAQGYMNAAQQAGNMYGNAGQQANNAGQGLYGAGQQAYETGNDPRHAIYNQNLGDLTENVRAGEYARGISMSPAGASVEANALGRFQNDWQNQQQQRQLSGLQGMGKAYGEAAGLQGQGAQFTGMSGSVPYDARNNVFGQQRDAVNNFFGAQQPYLQGLNQLQSNSLGYMNNAQGAQNQAFNQNMQNRQMQNQNWQQLAPLVNNFGSQAKSWWDGWGNNGDMSTHDYGSSYDPYQSSMSGGYDPQGL